MTPRLSPLECANAVARNIVPLAGILFLGWSAPTVPALYFVDPPRASPGSRPPAQGKRRHRRGNRRILR